MTRNIGFSIASFASSLLVAFFVSPMILRNLGDIQYGVWALFGEIITYYGLLDFGVRGAVNYYAGTALARNDDAAVRRYVSSGFFGLVTLSAAVFLVSISLVLAFRNSIVPGAGVNDTDIVGAACVFLAIFCIGVPIEVFAAVLIGGRRAYLVSTSELTAVTVSTTLMITALLTAPNIFWVAAAQLAGRSVYWTCVLRHVRKHVPQAVVSFRMASLQSLRELLRYGSKNAVIQMSWLLVNRKDVTLTTMFLGPQFVPTFSFARTAVQSLSQACSSITQPVRPNLVYYWARGEYEKAYAVYYKISRYSSFLVLMTAAFLAAFAGDFLRLWIGARFVTGNPLFRADIVLWILLCAHLPRMMHSISWQLLFAQNRQKALTLLICVEAVVNTGLALFLIQRYGTVGLATATLLPMFLSHVVALPLIMRKIAGVSLRRYVIEGIGRPLAGALVVAAAAFALRGRMPVHSWADLFLNAGILASLALLIGAVFVVRSEDRQRALSILSSLRSRLRAQAAASQRA